MMLISAGACVLVSCAPVYKARVDMTATGGILWPGPPEKPRVRYLWSLRDVGAPGEGENRYLDLLAGRTLEDISDPQTSPTLLRPQGVFVDENRYYIADPGAARVSVIDRKTTDVFHITEASDESLAYPRSVIADGAGAIVIADSELKKVLRYSPSGKFVGYFEGEFQRPEGLAIDASRGIVYVVDTDAHAVYSYGTDGRRKGNVGRVGIGAGEFYYPTYAAVDRSGNLYVTDFLNFRIQVFSPDLQWLTSIGSQGDSFDTLDKPKGVAVDSGGHVYIVDAAQNMVKVFSREGKLLLFFGEKGHGYGEFYLPSGIFIDNRDTIYVADSLNMRVQAFQFLGGD